MTGDASIRIDYDKVARDERLDGYKGYTTNSTLQDDRIIEEYGYLFMIERAFRFCKTDLDIRPMYHGLFNRIEAHVCICFVAYTIMLELECILKSAGSKISLDRARFLAEKIYQIDYVNPYDKKSKSVLLRTKEQPEVTELLGSSRLTAKMGVPLRKTGQKPRIYHCYQIRCRTLVCFLYE